MSETSEKASRLHNAGGNCCQAVVAACGELPEADAFRMGAAFGGGMRRGEVCGAVVGALMTLGLRHGARAPEEEERKADANDRTIAYMQAFKERYGSYLCRELIKASGRKVCDTVIPGAVLLLEELERQK
jgi:C_GCAxxG_C_C family probable redox protein